jgi:hypothetical protein
MPTLSCGHAPIRTLKPGEGGPTGFAITADGRHICYGCAAAEQRKRMRDGLPVYAYLSSDAKTLIAWSGEHLADVTRINCRKFRRNGRHVVMYYWRAVGEGRTWCGSGLGPTMSTRMRPTGVAK